MAQRKTKTISIPPDLDKQLDLFPEENWSAIACEAFRIRLTQLEAMNKAGTAEAAVARLRASRERGINEMFADGELAGADFAMNDGEFIELERLKRFRDRCGADWGRVIDQVHVQKLAEILNGDNEDSSGMEEWFRENHGAGCDDNSWREGFVHGALSKFEELQGKL